MNKQRRHSEAGFTLIELSIVLGVVAFILSTSLAVGSSVIENIRLTTTKDNMAIIKDAIENHVETYGYLPCPASPTLATSDNDYGVGLGSGTGDCTAAGLVNAIGSGSCTTGIVPFVQLGLPPAVALDGWGRKLSYSVQEAVTSSTGFNTQYTSALEAAKVFSLVSGGDQITSEAVYVLTSHGSNGFGAWPAKTGDQLPTVGAGAGEVENADFSDNIDGLEFVVAPQGSAFDDLILYAEAWQLVDPL